MLQVCWSLIVFWMVSSKILLYTGQMQDDSCNKICTGKTVCGKVVLNHAPAAKFWWTRTVQVLSAYHLYGNFGEKRPSNGNGSFFGTENRNGIELSHLQNTGNFFCLLSTWSLALVIQTNGTENFGRFGKNGKKVIPRNLLLFSGKFPPGWTVPFEFSPELLGFPHKW